MRISSFFLFKILFQFLIPNFSFLYQSSSNPL